MPKLRTVHYQDDRGLWHEVRVRPTVAKALEQMARDAEAHDRRWDRHNRPVDPLSIGRYVAAPEADAGRWEGPRLRPTLFVGHDRPWPPPMLPDGACAYCRGMELARGEYCLACDRSGFDGWLLNSFGPVEQPKPTTKALGLAGGLGPAKHSKRKHS